MLFVSMRGTLRGLGTGCGDTLPSDLLTESRIWGIRHMHGPKDGLRNGTLDLLIGLLTKTNMDCSAELSPKRCHVPG